MGVFVAVCIVCAVWTWRTAHSETLPSSHLLPVVRGIGVDCHAARSTLSSSPVVVMLISPRMVYSLSEWPRMRLAALAAGFDVVTWKAPGVPPHEWAQAVQAARWTPMQSALIGDAPAACSAWWQSLNHFPFSVVVQGDQVHGWPIWGVLPDEAWTASLAVRLEALREASIRNHLKSP